MARESKDREDLLREGTAMPIRGRLVIQQREIVMGFRSAGAFSLYCDQDPVFQFNAHSELRRVFFQGRKLKAAQGSLVELTRRNQAISESPEGKTAAQPLMLSETSIGEEQRKLILDDLKHWLQLIQACLQTEPVAQHQFACVGADAQAFQKKVLTWIQKCPSRQIIADGPGL
ncbi:hypothetical protein [Planctomycetes bacterium SV_7m_r]